MAPTADHAAADGQHVDRSHRRGRRQSHQKCGREHVDVGEHHVAADIKLRYVFIKLSCFVARWLASSSSLRADSAKRGRTISIVTLASATLAIFVFNFFFLVIA